MDIWYMIWFIYTKRCNLDIFQTVIVLFFYDIYIYYLQSLPNIFPNKKNERKKKPTHDSEPKRALPKSSCIPKYLEDLKRTFTHRLRLGARNRVGIGNGQCGIFFVFLLKNVPGKCTLNNHFFAWMFGEIWWNNHFLHGSLVKQQFFM